MCLAVYTLAGGKTLRGFMVKTLADRLGIAFSGHHEVFGEDKPRQTTLRSVRGEFLRHPLGAIGMSQ
jgi:hypothetical protein